MRHRIAFVAVAVALSAAACSKGGASTGGSLSPSGAASPRPSSTAQLTVLSPTNGEEIHGTSVSVKVKLTGATIVPATSANVVPDQGHLHVYLDNQLAAMNFQLDGVIPNVSAGAHILRVEFVAADHAPYDPRVIVQVTFQVQP
jgi:hypothetical protein